MGELETQIENYQKTIEELTFDVSVYESPLWERFTKLLNEAEEAEITKMLNSVGNSDAQKYIIKWIRTIKDMPKMAKGAIARAQTEKDELQREQLMEAYDEHGLREGVV